MSEQAHNIVNILHNSPEQWANAELAEPLTRLSAYGDILNHPTDEAPTPMPGSLEALRQQQTPEQQDHFAGTVERLYAAKERLRESGATNGNGQLLSDSMHLVPIPWAAFREALSKRGNVSTNSNEWHWGDRSKFKDDGLWFTLRSYTREHSTTLPELVNNIDPAIFGPLDPEAEDDSLKYRDPDNLTQLLTVEEYLDARIAYDGSFGVMLVQTEGSLGTRSDNDGLVDDGVSVVDDHYLGLHSADKLTNHGREHVEINGVPVDGLGTLEALALVLSTNPAEISSEFDTWLLANRTGEVTIRPTPYTTKTVTYAGQLKIHSESDDKYSSITFSANRIPADLMPYRTDRSISPETGEPIGLVRLRPAVRI